MQELSLVHGSHPEDLIAFLKQACIKKNEMMRGVKRVHLQVRNGKERVRTYFGALIMADPLGRDELYFTLLHRYRAKLGA
eukprot:309229-Pelagomonas_calceolata.AAC.1